MVRLLSLSLFFASLLLPCDVHSQHLVQKWFFKHKIKPFAEAIQAGKPLLVRWSNGTQELKTRGVLVGISADSLTLLPDTGKAPTVSIAKQSITKISYQGKGGGGQKTLGGVMLGVGAVILLILGAIALLSAVVYASTLGLAGEPEKSNKGCAWILVAMIAGFILLVSPKNHHIEKPFSGDWSIEEGKVEVNYPVP